MRILIIGLIFLIFVSFASAAEFTCTITMNETEPEFDCLFYMELDDQKSLGPLVRAGELLCPDGGICCKRVHLFCCFTCACRYHRD